MNQSVNKIPSFGSFGVIYSTVHQKAQQYMLNTMDGAKYFEKYFGIFYMILISINICT